MNNFNRREKKRLFGPDWVSIYERGANGRIHFHEIVDCRADVRTGCDFKAFKRQDYRSAPPELHRLWDELLAATNYNGQRRNDARYPDMGRFELMPFKSTREAVSHYVTKYVEKHIDKRRVVDKGVRLLRMSDGVRQGTVAFSWNTPGGLLWRLKIAQFAERMGYLGYEAFVQQWGKKWPLRVNRLVRGERLSDEVLCKVRSFARIEEGKPVVKKTCLAFYEPLATVRQVLKAQLALDGIPATLNIDPDEGDKCWRVENEYALSVRPGDPF